MTDTMITVLQQLLEVLPLLFFLALMGFMAILKTQPMEG